MLFFVFLHLWHVQGWVQGFGDLVQPGWGFGWYWVRARVPCKIAADLY